MSPQKTKTNFIIYISIYIVFIPNLGLLENPVALDYTRIYTSYRGKKRLCPSSRIKIPLWHISIKPLKQFSRSNLQYCYSFKRIL